jgi:hypothetical protein
MGRGCAEPEKPINLDKQLSGAMVTQIEQPRPKPSTRSGAKLTAYESAQISQIAAWKSHPPSALAEILRRITSPGVKLVERAVPDSLVRAVIDGSFEIAEKLSGKDDVKSRAGVLDVRELRQKELELCDHLATQAGVFSQVFATAEGAVTGAGGALTTLLDVPLLFILSLWTILKIGHCYGYPLVERRDRHFIVGTLIAALSGTLETRRRRLDELHELEDLLVSETQEEILTEELLSIVFQLEIFDAIPGVGAISGAALNLAFMRRVEKTARRVFQERWLRDSGKIRSISPAPAHPRNLAAGWKGAMGRAMHSGCYAAGFGVALPAFMIASLLGAPKSRELASIKS